MFRVAILGCGPAGLMAAEGAMQAGGDQVDITIFSKKRKSHLYGAQYLHRPIPGITDHNTKVEINYILHGTPDDYREKVYGRTPFIGEVSVEVLPSNHDAWDLRQTYDALWDQWNTEIENVEINPESVHLLYHKGADLIISTLPKPVLCWKGHTFRSQHIWAAGEAHDQNILLPYMCPDNTVVCNGTPDAAWYRLSKIYGVKSVEWSLHSLKSKPPVGSPTVVNKPIDNNCNCWDQTVVFAGRYGEWKKGVLSSDAHAVGIYATLEKMGVINAWS